MPRNPSNDDNSGRKSKDPIPKFAHLDGKSLIRREDYEKFLHDPEILNIERDIALLRALVEADLEEPISAFESPTQRRESLSKILEKVGKLAEKAKRMREGTVVKVDINISVLQRFLDLVVFPYANPDTRRKMQTSAVGFYKTLASGESKLLEEGAKEVEYIDAEARVVPGRDAQTILKSILEGQR